MAVMVTGKDLQRNLMNRSNPTFTVVYKYFQESLKNNFRKHVPFIGFFSMKIKLPLQS